MQPLLDPRGEIVLRRKLSRKQLLLYTANRQRMLIGMEACLILNDPAPTEIYPLSLHDALPIWTSSVRLSPTSRKISAAASTRPTRKNPDRKSTRLNSSHLGISYAVFCLKK